MELHRDSRIARTLAAWHCAEGSSAVAAATALFHGWDEFTSFFDAVLPKNEVQRYATQRYSEDAQPCDYAFILAKLRLIGVRRETLKQGIAYIRGMRVYSDSHSCYDTLSDSRQSIAAVAATDGDYVLRALGSEGGDAPIDAPRVFSLIAGAAARGIPAEYLAALSVGQSASFSTITAVEALHRAGVPAEYADALYIWDAVNIAAFWEHQVPTSYIRQLPSNGVAVDPTDILLLHRENVPVEYATACLTNGLTTDETIGSFENGLTAEYATALHV